MSQPDPERVQGAGDLATTAVGVWPPRRHDLARELWQTVGLIASVVISVAAAPFAAWVLSSLAK